MPGKRHKLTPDIKKYKLTETLINVEDRDLNLPCKCYPHLLSFLTFLLLYKLLSLFFLFSSPYWPQNMVFSSSWLPKSDNTRVPFIKYSIHKQPMSKFPYTLKDS